LPTRTAIFVAVGALILVALGALVITARGFRASSTTGATTQALTDGEIRYIIANGIQLTGMLAMPALDGQEDRVMVPAARTPRSPRARTFLMPRRQTA
jgi:hypothetical protein